jgi:hypothetical protein
MKLVICKNNSVPDFLLYNDVNIMAGNFEA